MLGKLLKHEFRATGRIMGPLYLVLLVLSFGGNLSIRIFDSAESTWLEVLGVLIMVAFGFVIVGIIVVTIVLMVNRFKTNLMSDEGYVMFTLPVTVDQLVLSKIIVSTVWFVATLVAVSLSGLIVAFRVSFIKEFADLIRAMFDNLTTYYAINGAAVILEALVLMLIGCAIFCLLFYAAMAVGHSFSTHKKLLSFISFLVFMFVTQIVLICYRFYNAIPRCYTSSDVWNISGIAAFHISVGIFLACSLIYAAIFYVITTIILKKRLNLE